MERHVEVIQKCIVGVLAQADGARTEEKEDSFVIAGDRKEFTFKIGLRKGDIKVYLKPRNNKEVTKAVAVKLRAMLRRRGAGTVKVIY